ncbi:MAG: OsmC family protein [Cellulomonas sp.]|uniref:OsmC family protein n=1 Tax=Cellulomonas sp. TaxID=40001 RepID=UPI0019F84F60|nr:OsmC family protein [Cellulomonas sp.]MBF0689063.1 OsmC family protein [Cellulomonas sp.]
MSQTYAVVVAAGSLRSPEPDATTVPHRWTAQGVTIEAPFTGAHLLHTAVAGCVLNDLYREADRLGVVLHGVRVAARGGFDGSWASTGITYAVDLDTPSASEDVERLLAVVDDVAEIPRAVRAGASVTRATTSS